ncbi:MAG: phage minor head protein [Treponemataceae bacterium]
MKKQIIINVKDITAGNRKEKFNNVSKCLYGLPFDRVAIDNTKRLKSITIKINDCSNEKIEKALRTLAFSIDVPFKSPKGEVFLYKSQEDLTNKWSSFFSDAVRDVYSYIVDYFELPELRTMSKSVLKYKGKILYYPDRGEPIKQKEWDSFVSNLEKFINGKTDNAGKKIILNANTLGAILNRMLKYNTFNDVKNIKLEELKYHNKTFDWISDSSKNMKSVFGESLSRNDYARIEIVQQSTAQKITKVSNSMKSDIQQIFIDGIRAKKSKSQVSQALFDKMVGYNRDYQRIADTEIQNAVNTAFVREEAYKAGDKKIYFQRIEIVDDNTCAFCKKTNGKIVAWSDVPLSTDKIKDQYTDVAIWDGKEWSGKKNEISIGVFHPYCRGSWVRWDNDGSKKIDALIADIDNNGKHWNASIALAKKEFNDKGIENPNDSTKGYTDRIQEIYQKKIVNKSLTYSGFPLQGRKVFAGLNISIENKKGSTRRGVDENGKKWATKMNYDYGYIRGSIGVDGDHVDCYLGGNENAEYVYIVHQNNPYTGKYDEDKCMIGFDSIQDAKDAFLSQYDNKDFLGDVSIVPISIFKEKVVEKKYHGKKLKIS